jgi:thiol:disulfide interchange protein DsbD
LGCAIKIISAFPPTLEYSESPKGWSGASAVNTAILPEGAVRTSWYYGFEDYEKVQLTPKW